MLRRTDRLISSRFLYPTTCISIHAPMNGATSSSISSANKKLISIHAPTNGATGTGCRIWLDPRNFNPRSDERSDLTLDIMADSADISIHAPTNGATALFYLCFLFKVISIHAPTNGATNTIAAICQMYNISIHAPTNGATELPMV